VIEHQGFNNIRLIKSLSDFINDLKSDVFPLLKEEKKGTNNPKPLFWFRGQKNLSWGLCPSLFRHYKKNLTATEFWLKVFNEETLLLKKFKIKGVHILSQIAYSPELFINNDYAWLSTMQHYGTKTRLLDWTEDALTAFNFAINDYFNASVSLDRQTLPCVWVLGPIRMMKKLQGHINFKISGKSEVLSLSDNKQEILFSINELKVLLEKHPKLRKIPIPFIPPYYHRRLKAQKGTFVLFPQQVSKTIFPAFYNNPSLEMLPSSEQFLKKYILVHPNEIKKELRLLGYRNLSQIYPELAIIGKETQ
jgi:hypothetical protein